MHRPNAGRKSRHTAEQVLRINRLAEAGVSQSEIGRHEGMDRHRAADIIDGMFDHLVPPHKCLSCHRIVYGVGPCVACRANGGKRINTTDGGIELALEAEEETLRLEIWRTRMAGIKARG